MDEPKLEAAVGMSRKWDAREAGREVARSTIQKLSHPPSFILLFSTIHYKDHGGFQELLNGVWEVLPKGTPLIGGTISSFINNYGCYARGATALAISYPKMDVAIGIGRHTKITPKRAATKCAEAIKKELNNSKYENKFLIDLISGPTIPELPLIGKLNVNVKSKIVGTLLSHIGVRLFSYFGHGIGKEGDTVDQLALRMPEYQIIGNSLGERFFNYQFMGKNVYNNVITALGCVTDLQINLNSSIASHKTDKTFRITGTAFDNRIITKIENKPATPTLFNLLDMPTEQFGDLDDFYYKTSVYFPFTFEDGKENTLGVCGIFGNNIVLHEKITSKNVRLLSVTGKEIVDNVDKILENINTNLPFMLIFFSSIYSYILRDRTFDIKDRLDQYLGDIPYLAVGSLVENIRIVGRDPSIRVYSFNTISLEQEFRKK